jgi:preprotein translocase subunit SecA
VVTVNDFLAEYQAGIMSRVFRALGMSTGVILADQSPEERRKQYQADITYGTNNEFGFDYLKDNMAATPDDLVQRGHFFSIVDEVDSILIDEARTPLIISGPASGEADRWFGEFAKIAKRLRPDIDFEFDEAKKTVGVLEPGIDKVEDWLGIENLYAPENTPLVSFLTNALKAKSLFKRDKDYVVLNGEVMIVDEHTGRILEGRRYSEGVHQSIEAKENVEVQPENQTYATVTLQNYFRLYDKLAGMTGTAETEAGEFMATYKLGVVIIPTNKTVQRVDQADLIYKNEQVKFRQVVEDIAMRHQAGQPVLAGTTSVEKSEYLSKLLQERGIPHEVLNAKNHAREAAIVAQAGRLGAVTVATNMAGRGTDIMLGGNTEFLATAAMHERGLSETETPEEYEAQWPQVLEEVKQAVADEAERVANAGGLYVLGTERHESRRIDNQLRGRSGRQGDPGETRFYLSLTDDLMRLFNSGAAETLMGRSGLPDDTSIESRIVSRAIRSAQGQVEGQHAEVRKNVLKYDDVMDRQRKAIYTDREHILRGDDMHQHVEQFMQEALYSIIDSHTDSGNAEGWDFEALWDDLKKVYPVSVSIEELFEAAGGRGRVNRELLHSEILSDAQLTYQAREEKLGDEQMRNLERRAMLIAIDQFWRDNLYEMDYLKEGIGLRAYSQRDPLVEYQREGYSLFSRMMESIREETIALLFRMSARLIEAGDQAELESPAPAPDPALLHFTAPSEDGEADERPAS